jgi:hypothetical protein
MEGCKPYFVTFLVHFEMVSLFYFDEPDKNYSKNTASFTIFLCFLVCILILVVICRPNERSNISHSIFFMSFSALVSLPNNSCIIVVSTMATPRGLRCFQCLKLCYIFLFSCSTSREEVEVWLEQQPGHCGHCGQCGLLP